MPKKIFELAKELDIRPFDLVDKLRENGFSVRNHMAVLSDEDVQKVQDLFTAQKAQIESKKKKKVVRKKKVAKKKTTTAKTSKKEKEKEQESSSKVITVKRKTVVRKKNVEEPSAIATQPEAVLAQDEAITSEVTDTTATDLSEDKLPTSSGIEEVGTVEALEANKDELTDKAVEQASAGVSIKKGSSGLRVVHMPDPAVEQADKQEDDGAKQGQDKEAPKAKKAHKFTPVYIPPKKEANSTDKETESETKKETTTEAAADGDSEGRTKSNKRLGNLASMMSGKPTKGLQNRARTMSLSRAEEELKSYSTLSSLGKPIYNQVKRKKVYLGARSKTEITDVKESKRIVYIHQVTSAEELAKKLSVKFQTLADDALSVGLLLKSEDYLGLKLCTLLAGIYEYRVEDRAFNEDEVIGIETLSEEDQSKLPLRDPIITIMGHVDHGKTTLLDHIRNSKVVQGEAGGITQHIGAYSVKVGEKTLTFLDTPGHAAFTSMRQRGANVTDIVILVVAADDGVMPQTKESIRFCQQAEVPIIVAVNKMDKEGSNPDKVKQELAEFHITPEEWGGDTQFVPISALKGDGIDDLLEAAVLQADMQELRADSTGKAEGVVVESKIEQGRGPVATVLIQKGTLKKGDSIVIGECSGRARNLMNSLGKILVSAGPSIPVQILGLDSTPLPGDILNVVKNEREAKKIVANRVQQRKEMDAMPVKGKISLEDFFAAEPDNVTKQKDLNLIIRADVQGSYEAIKQSLLALGNKEVTVKIIGGGVGAITDSDVALAKSSLGFIIGFNMRPISSARRLAEADGIDIKTYSVIYELINDVKLATEGLLEPEFHEQFLGRAEVRETFMVPKVGVIAGCFVGEGKIVRGCNIRLLRNGKIVFDGKMSSLRRFKDDVKDVQSGYECGIGLENFNDVKVGDQFEAYERVEKKRTLEDLEREELEKAKAQQEKEQQEQQEQQDATDTDHKSQAL
ncbi:MAG: translation initiation factor IF-2 [Bacteriovoracaceae bacterium]|nr:translation initiation factor IF-2 [Bacteriovoracaceae bacterium]